jgi:hypothetical protein
MFFSNIELINSKMLPSVYNSWLSGFIDAEGCFNVHITKRQNTITGFRVILRFILDQKDAFETLSDIKSIFMFGKVILRNKTNNVYRYYMNSFIRLQIICDYLKSYPLKTNKQISYLNWCKIYEIILQKEHLTQEGLVKIRELKKFINKNNSLIIKTGSRKPK